MSRIPDIGRWRTRLVCPFCMNTMATKYKTLQHGPMGRGTEHIYDHRIHAQCNHCGYVPKEGYFVGWKGMNEDGTNERSCNNTSQRPARGNVQQCVGT
jgi:hypothetical protein